MIWPAPGVTAAELTAALTRAHDVSNPVLVGANSPAEQIDKYLSWVVDAARILGTTVRRSDLDRLLYTPRYWATLANPIPAPSVLKAVHQEVYERLVHLDEVRAEAAALRDHWAPSPRGTHVVVPDTGILLHHTLGGEPANIDSIDWRAMIPVRTFDEVRVVIPIVVVDELEGIKDKRKDDLGRQARRVVNQLFTWFENRPTQPYELATASNTSGAVCIELLADERGHARLPRNDDELVDRAVAVRDVQAAPVHFLSYDTGAVLRAKVAGLNGRRLRD